MPKKRKQTIIRGKIMNIIKNTKRNQPEMKTKSKNTKTSKT
jgi:hypothetical protein